MIYLFDVDGTLTDSSAEIDPTFKSFFIEWMDGKECYLVSGASRNKTQRQLGEDLWGMFTGCFQDGGNTYYKDGKEVYAKKWEPNRKLLFHLNDEILKSKFTKKTGNHIERRSGLINFSFVGQFASDNTRDHYKRWDRDNKQRDRFVRESSAKFPMLDFKIGGDVSVDIYPMGNDKGQVLKQLDYDEITFFGDRCEAGNDEPLASKLSGESRFFNVKNWKNTLYLLGSIS
jgi:phosphomannomutase